MDADKRHQLKQNELAEAINRLRDVRDPRFLATLGVLAVVVVGLLGWKAWNYSQRLKLEQTSQRLSTLQEALNSFDGARIARAQEELRELLSTARNADLVAAARLLLARSRYDQAMRMAAERPAGFEEAAAQLEQINATPGVSPMLQAAATYLLANTYESLRRFDEARTLWQRLSRDAQYAGTPYRALAEGRLLTMDELSTAVAFRPGDPPPPPPAGGTGDGIKLVPGESVLIAPNVPPLVVPTEPTPPRDEAPETPEVPEAAEAQPPAEEPAPDQPAP